MLLKINHTTRYSYETPVNYALQQTRLKPQNGPLQTVKDWNVTVDGGRIELSYTDHHDNLVDLLSADRGVTEIAITASGTVETTENAGIYGQTFGRAPLWYYGGATELTTPGKGTRALAKRIKDPAQPLDDLHALSAEILSAVPYRTGITNAHTTAEDALAVASGVCQDHAHIFVTACRTAGIPARYVSGYLMMNDRIEQEASHGWAEAFCPDLGWVGFDVSNGYSPDERYIRLGCGRDARDVAPISGLRIGRGDERMIVSLAVQQ